MMMVMTAGAIRCVRLQSSHHRQQINTQLFTDWIHPANSVKALKEDRKVKFYRVSLNCRQCFMTVLARQQEGNAACKDRVLVYW